MRRISNDIAERLSRTIQTRKNNANPSAAVWVTRPTTNLVSDDFLEKQTILEAPVTDVSIAACHPYANLGETHIYVGYISNGHAKLLCAETKTNILGHIWNEVDFDDTASAISVAFNGIMSASINDKVEIVTERNPWVFWVKNGELNAKKIGGDRFVLTSEGCTDVSAIRAVWGLNGSLDFGLIVFFILNKKIYYRQLINNEWMDAQEVNFGPKVDWKKISAFRTWDYRVGLQAQAVNGDIYEIFTQFMGIGRHNTEHIDVSSINIDSELIDVDYKSVQGSLEHISLGEISSDAPYTGLYSVTIPEILSVHNKDDGNGNWARYVDVVFNNHINKDTVKADISAFTISDSNGNIFPAVDAALDESGKIITLDFVSLMSASSNCDLIYSNGSLESMAGIKVPDLQFSFALEHIGESGKDGNPVPIHIYNSNSEGSEIVIEFSGPLVGGVIESKTDFTITIQEYEFTPGGNLMERNVSVTEVKNDYSTFNQSVDLSSGTYSNVELKSSGIKLEVDNG